MAEVKDKSQEELEKKLNSRTTKATSQNASFLGI